MNSFAIAACESAAANRATEISQLSANLYHPNYQAPVVPKGQVRFALPMGVYASPALLTQELERFVQEGNRTIALSSANPYQMFSQLASGLSVRGIRVRVKGSVSLAQTAFGVAWTSLLRFFGCGDSCHQRFDQRLCLKCVFFYG